MDDDITVIYSNGSDILTFNYFKVGNTNLYLDTENTKTTNILINGVEGEYIEKDKEYTFIWEKDGYCYILGLEYADKKHISNQYDELIRITKNMKKIEK